MNTIKNILTIAWKDLKILFKDRGALAVYFLLPLLFAVIQGAPAKMAENLTDPESENVPTIQAYIVNEDAGPYGAQVVAGLGEVRMLRLETVESADRADELVADGEAPAAIVIPADFSQKLQANEPTQVRLIKDPTQQDEALLIAGILNNAMNEFAMMAEIEYGIRAVYEETGALEGAAPDVARAAQAQTMGTIWTAVQEMRQNPIIALRTENLAGEETEGEWNPFGYLMPMFATMFAFFLVSAIAGSLVGEKEAGSLRRLVAAPIHRGAIIAGKMTAHIVVVFLQMALMFTVGSVLFDMSLGHSPLGLVVLTLAVALASTGLGMLVGALSRTANQADKIGIALGFILMAAGGFLWTGGEYTFRSEGFQFYVTQATPHAHALDAYLKLMSEGAGLVNVLPNIAVLLGFAAVFFLIAMWRFKFE